MFKNIVQEHDANNHIIVQENVTKLDKTRNIIDRIFQADKYDLLSKHPDNSHIASYNSEVNKFNKAYNLEGDDALSEVKDPYVFDESESGEKLLIDALYNRYLRAQGISI